MVALRTQDKHEDWKAPFGGKPKHPMLMRRPFGSLQVVIGLLQLSDVFVELLLDAARLAEVVLQH